LFIGVLVAQGLAQGLQLLFNAGVLAATEETTQSVWRTLFGLLLLQILQSLGVLAGGTLAGAGSKRGTMLGAIVGLVNGVVFVITLQLNGERMTEISLYGLPLLHLAFGTIGGWIGSLIWRPLPTLIIPGSKDEQKLHPSISNGPFFLFLAGPIAWKRVLLGTVIVVAGVLSPKAILDFVLQASQGKLSINSHLQAQLVTWEIIGLITLTGAAIAGATSLNGLKQGLCVGLGASAILAGFQLGRSAALLEQTLFLTGVVMALTLGGGWFGGQLFPPVRPILRGRAKGVMPF
jgi:hypothetical protein